MKWRFKIWVSLFSWLIQPAANWTVVSSPCRSALKLLRAMLYRPPSRSSHLLHFAPPPRPCTQHSALPSCHSAARTPSPSSHSLPSLRPMISPCSNSSSAPAPKETCSTGRLLRPMHSSPSPSPSPSMCKTKVSTLASEPRPRSRTSSVARTASSDTLPPTSSSDAFPTDSSSRRRKSPFPPATAATSSSSTSSAGSLASFRDSLPEPPAFYPFSELCSATNNFLSKRLNSSSSSAWRCSLRGKDAIVFQRRFRGGDPAALHSRLVALGKSHHSSLIRLLGASLAGDHIYLVYEFTAGASLAECLHNPHNPDFTPLSSWVSRVQVAADIAQGLEYNHRHSSIAGGVHNRIKSSAIIVTDPGFRAKICHFGATDLAGEIPVDSIALDFETGEKANGSRVRIEGTRAYMAPEVLAGGRISQRSDVYGLGVVLLELLSGEEPLKYRFDQNRKVHERVSVVETAREAIGKAEEEPTTTAAAEEGVRWWVDKRLKDSFYVPAAEKLIRVALRCVEEDPAARPTMDWVAGKVSMIYVESMKWAATIRIPTEISVSMAPR